MGLICLAAGSAMGQSTKTFNDLDAATIADGDKIPFWDISASGTAKTRVTTFVDFKTALGLAALYQPLDSDLTIYAGITPSANVQTLLGAADYAAFRTSLSLVIGTNVQAYDADLTTWAGITPSANVQTLLGAADYAAFRTSLGLVIGTNVQAWDADLDTWATKTAPSGTVVGTSDAQTLTTKRVTPRVAAISYAASITPAGDSSDVVNVGALTGDITIANPSGTPTDGQKLTFRLVQDGSGSHTITWGNLFVFGTDVTAALIPSAASVKWEMVFQWNATDSLWRAVGIARGF